MLNNVLSKCRTHPFCAGCHFLLFQSTRSKIRKRILIIENTTGKCIWTACHLRRALPCSISNDTWKFTSAKPIAAPAGPHLLQLLQCCLCRLQEFLKWKWQSNASTLVTEWHQTHGTTHYTILQGMQVIPIKLIHTILHTSAKSQLSSFMNTTCDIYLMYAVLILNFSRNSWHIYQRFHIFMA